MSFTRTPAAASEGGPATEHTEKSWKRRWDGRKGGRLIREKPQVVRRLGQCFSQMTSEGRPGNLRESSPPRRPIHARSRDIRTEVSIPQQNVDEIVKNTGIEDPRYRGENIHQRRLCVRDRSPRIRHRQRRGIADRSSSDHGEQSVARSMTRIRRWSLTACSDGTCSSERHRYRPNRRLPTCRGSFDASVLA